MKYTAEKPFRCDYSGRQFSQNANLKCHIRVHTDEKPFDCPECGR